jgi:hypothetical protein
MDPLALIFIVITALWVVLAFAVAFAAERRGMTPVLWFGIAVFVSPLIAAVLLLAVSDGQRSRPSR